MLTDKDMKDIVFRLDYETDAEHAERRARALRDLNRLKRDARVSILAALLCAIALAAYMLYPDYGGSSARAMYVSFFATMTVSALMVLAALRSKAR